MKRRRLADVPVGELSSEELAVRFMPFARRIAADMKPGDDDAYGDALMGLLSAARAYDPNLGNFVAYARKTIATAVRRGGYRLHRGFKVTTTFMHGAAELRAAAERADCQIGDTDRLAAELPDWDRDRIVHFSRMMASVASLDAPLVSESGDAAAYESVLDLAERDEQAAEDRAAAAAAVDAVADLCSGLPADMVARIDRYIDRGSGDPDAIGAAVRDILGEQNEDHGVRGVESG